MRDAIAASVRSNRRRFYPFFSAMEPEALRESIRDFNGDIREVLGVNNRLMESDPARLYRNIFKSSGEYGVPFMTKLRMFNRAPLAALGWGPKSWRAAQLAPTQTKIPGGLYGSAAGFIAGQALAPALDYFANEVYKDPTSGGHWLSTIGKHAVGGVTSGVVAGGAIGAAFGGVGAAPGAAIGAVAGGIVGALQGVFDSISQVNADEARTAEEVKRRNEQIRANWKKVEEALPKAQ